MNNSALYAFNKYCDTVLRTAFAMTGSYPEAEDITQEVFLTLHAKPQNFESEEHMKAWLLRAAINRCKNYRVSAHVRRDQPLDDELSDKLSCEFSPRDNEIREGHLKAGLTRQDSDTRTSKLWESFSQKDGFSC